MHIIINLYFVPIGLPDEYSRSEIFEKILEGVTTDENFDFTLCGKYTDGYSPSDIVALCKSAMSIPLREQRLLMKTKFPSASTSTSTPSITLPTIIDRNNSTKLTKLRPLTTNDIEYALKTFTPSSSSSSTLFNKKKSNNNYFADHTFTKKSSDTSPSSSSQSSNSGTSGGSGNTNGFNGQQGNGNLNGYDDDSQRFWNPGNDDKDQDDDDDDDID